VIAIVSLSSCSGHPSVTATPASALSRQAGPALLLAGLAYGPYHLGQDPNYGISPSAEEIAADIPTLASLTGSIRIYSSLGPAPFIVHDAERVHLSVDLGIWLGRDAAANRREITAGISLMSSPAISTVTVGNEVLLRGDLTEAQLVAAIQQVRTAARHIHHRVLVTTADVDAMWLQHPSLARYVDAITVHLYPFWQKIPISAAIGALARSYAKITTTFPGKKVIIGETGWPSSGPPQGAAVPSAQNQAGYLAGFLAWAKRQPGPVQYYYFDAFDEAWKTNEHGVGTYWGLYDQRGHPKPALTRLLPAAVPLTVQERSYRDVLVGSRLETPFNLGIDTDQHQRHWLTAGPGMLTLAYPAGQQWGAMFITVGPPVPAGHRPSVDLSRYRSLQVQLRASTNGQRVRLGIKDRHQLDNGSEITVEQTLTTHWTTVALPLSLFANVDKRHLYVVFELVFQGSAAETADVRDVRYATAAVPAPAFPPASMPFPVYTDGADPANHYVPSGYMGDHDAMSMDQFWTHGPHDGKTCIQVVYNPAPAGQGWAGVYWQSPADNWGAIPRPAGYDLSRATQLSFWVRGSHGTERIQFLAGGITGTYGDSLQPAIKTQVLTLSTTWQRVTINLAGNDLTHVIGGFGWVAKAQDNPQGATFYLDDIIYTA
jgi:glucan 1,3-beta-glucosidase